MWACTLIKPVFLSKLSCICYASAFSLLIRENILIRINSETNPFSAEQQQSDFIAHIKSYIRILFQKQPLPYQNGITIFASIQSKIICTSYKIDKSLYASVLNIVRCTYVKLFFCVNHVSFATESNSRHAIYFSFAKLVKESAC